MIATDTVRTETISTYDSYNVQEKKRVETTQEDKADNAEQQDSLELHDESEPLISENYSNLRYIPIMPASIFGNKYGPVVHREISRFMEEYAKGNAAIEELKQYFVSVCEDMQAYMMKIGRTTGDSPADNKQIISQVYEAFQKHNASMMAYVCMKEGEGIAAQYGNAGDRDWVYYDTAYKKKCIDTQGFLREIADEMVAEWKAESIDYDKVERESSYIVNGALDFDSCWNHQAINKYLCTLEELQQKAGMAGQDSDGERFSFFYKECANPFIPGVNTLESQMGILLIRLGTQSWKIDVPFNNSTVLGKLASQFNAKNLFEKSNAIGNPVLMRWLSRFTIFTRVRGHERIREEILGKR